jgi:GntR family transcriptional regulator/MocR family aminotransferase
VGWLAAPPELREEVLATRRTTGTRPAPAGQEVLAQWARDGALGRHLARLRRELGTRRRVVVEAVTGAGQEVLGDRAGAHLVVPLASAADEQVVVARAAEAGLLVDGLAAHHLAVPVCHGILVGWAAPTRTELIDALGRLENVLARVPGTARGADVAPA